jgi:hypothetical protein
MSFVGGSMDATETLISFNTVNCLSSSCSIAEYFAGWERGILSDFWFLVWSLLWLAFHEKTANIYNLFK